MPLVVVLLIYVLFALVVGLEGRNTRAGVFGTFVLSLLITPLISYILLLCFEEMSEHERHARKARKKGTA